MKVAVTGATGFVGRHVVAALSREAGVSVVTSSRGGDAGGADGGVRHVPLDIAQPSLGDYHALGRPDVLIHLSWSGLPNYRSLHHFESELPRQHTFLSGLVRAGLPALVCTGTCFEYGMQSGALDETMRPDPQNPYGFAKDALRRQLAFLRDSTPFRFTWARLFYMYGEGQSAQSLYPLLASAAERGERVFRMSGGEQLRDYLPVSEMASMLVGLALRAPDAGIVNVCSGRPVAVRSLVEGWIRQNNWNLALELGHYPYPDYEPMAFWGCREKLTRALNLS
ncbi:MAG TPA: NAD(P)-dependent oxidoreductase [Caldimonas sp.]|jgi:dTDP-6-deoxy-L-talose 4-dehydrogenase (NAD+)|nr:NAD(P)-dependent oxidoreductase [Caldimonas sp.]HEX2542303.1 NAD(P)-dependent oxidoreductase [Caldimonas sp.]